MVPRSSRATSGPMGVRYPPRPAPLLPSDDRPPMTPGNDEALMGALAAGDDTALNPLMDRWQVPLRRFLYRYTQNEHDALDLAQETFVRLSSIARATAPGRASDLDVPDRAQSRPLPRPLAAATRPTRWRASRTLQTQAPNLRRSRPCGARMAAERAAAVKAAVAALPGDCARRWCSSNTRKSRTPRSPPSCARRRRRWRPGFTAHGSSCERRSPSIWFEQSTGQKTGAALSGGW